MSVLCCNNNNCLCKSLIASIIIGIITAFLTFSATITVTPAFLWVTFGIAVVFLALTAVISATNRNHTVRECMCAVLPYLLTGILGTILTSLVLLAISFAATSVIGAIITGALLTFFSLIITSTACLIKCNSACCQNNGLNA